MEVRLLCGSTVSELEPPVRPNFRSPPRRRGWLATCLVLPGLDPPQAASKLPAPAIAPVAAIPRRNWRRPNPPADPGVMLRSDRSTALTSTELNLLMKPYPEHDQISAPLPRHGIRAPIPRKTACTDQRGHNLTRRMVTPAGWCSYSWQVNPYSSAK